MKVLATFSFVLVMCALAQAQAIAPAAVKAEDKATIDVVFCIDCSGSMGGVIEAAKQKVWAIVNEVARVKPTPVLRIGLYGYGNSEGPFRKFELSDDLDTVYQNLMTFKDEGWGSEYVGLVIQRAADDMKWAEGNRVLKIIYVVGNETARQGPVDYTKSAPAAIAKGIFINPIYCGNTDYAQATPTWREIARLADGQYMEIAGGGGAIIVKTPYDDELAAMNTKLNGTYIAYGARGASGLENQVVQDSNSVQMGAGANTILAERASAKATAVYSNARWDLVDAAKEKDFKLSAVKDADLPAELKELTPEKRVEYIQVKAKEREEIQAQIKALAEKRQAAVQEEIRKQGLKTDQSLDEAVKASIRDQARKRGFEIAS